VLCLRQAGERAGHRQRGRVDCFDRQFVLLGDHAALRQIGRPAVADVEGDRPRCRVVDVRLQMAAGEGVLIAVPVIVDLGEVDVIERPLYPAEDSAAGNDLLPNRDVFDEVVVVEFAPATAEDDDLVGDDSDDLAVHDRIDRRAGLRDDVDPGVE